MLRAVEGVVATTGVRPLASFASSSTLCDVSPRLLLVLPVLLLAACSCGRGPEPPPDVVVDLPAACHEPGTCELGYRAWISTAPGPDRRIHPLDLEALVAPTLTTPPLTPDPPWEPAELERRVLDGIRAESLVGGLPERLPEVGVRRIARIDGGHRLTLRFDDPQVGASDAVLLLPAGSGPHAAIVVHPGHAERPDDHLDKRFGRGLPEAGIAVLLMDPRVHDSDPVAAALTEDLLLQGLTLVGLRVYELLAARAWLAGRPDIDGDRIALGGHSGGALVANLAVRIDPRPAALVTDLTSNYFSVEDGAWQDESAPDLPPLEDLLADFSTVGVPVLEAEYGYPGGDASVLPFLEEALGVR